jgi:hypothetical protein
LLDSVTLLWYAQNPEYAWDAIAERFDALFTKMA